MAELRRAAAVMAVTALMAAGCSSEPVKEKKPVAKPSASASPTLPPGAVVMPEKIPGLKVLKEVSITKGDVDLGVVLVPRGKEFFIDFSCSGSGKATVIYAGPGSKFEHTCGGVPMQNTFAASISHPEQMKFAVDVPNDDTSWALRVQQ